jgi:hypothetical protein
VLASPEVLHDLTIEFSNFASWARGFRVASLSVHATYLFALFGHFGAAAIASGPVAAVAKTATANAPAAINASFSIVISWDLLSFPAVSPAILHRRADGSRELSRIGSNIGTPIGLARPRSSIALDHGGT